MRTLRENASLSHRLTLKATVFGALLCAALLGHAEDLPDNFASHTPLNLSGAGPWYRLELPLSVQLNARQGNLNDVRVFNADGQAQPYALTLGQPQHARDEQPIPVKWFPLYNRGDAKDAEPGIRVQRSASGTLIEVQPQGEIDVGDEVLRGWLLDTSAIKVPLDQLIIDWSTEHEGFQRFRIDASDDLQHWKRWGEGQVARLSFADELVEQRSIALPGQTARYLRLLWITPQAAPTLSSAQILGSRPDVMPLSWSAGIAGSTEKPGVYAWQLPVALPVERVKVAIAQPNSLAPGTLYGRNDSKAPWRLIDSALLYRLTQNGEDVTQDEMALSGDGVRQLKLEVDGRGGGLGVEAPRLSVAVRATQLVFLARGAPPYSLAMGNATIDSANLPLSTLIPGVTPEQMTALGKAELTSPPVAAAPLPIPDADGMDWKRVGLWAVLLIGVSFLGWMAISTLRASSKSRSG